MPVPFVQAPLGSCYVLAVSLQHISSHARSRHGFEEHRPLRDGLHVDRTQRADGLEGVGLITDQPDNEIRDAMALPALERAGFAGPAQFLNRRPQRIASRHRLHRVPMRHCAKREGTPLRQQSKFDLSSQALEVTPHCQLMIEVTAQHRGVAMFFQPSIELWLPRPLDRIRRLGEHLGPNLFQLPPRWRRDVPRLEAVLELLADEFDLSEDGVVELTVPPAAIQYVDVDNEETQILDRETGLFTRGDPRLESDARSVADETLRQAALDSGILEMAEENAEQVISNFLLSLGYRDVILEFE